MEGHLNTNQKMSVRFALKQRTEAHVVANLFAT